MLAVTASAPTACERDFSACSNGHAEPARIIPELSASNLRKDYVLSFIQNVLCPLVPSLSEGATPRAEAFLQHHLLSGTGTEKLLGMPSPF